MLLTEVIESGRPFKRPHNKGYLEVEEGIVVFQGFCGEAVRFTVRDIVATDWKLQEEPLEITYDQFYAALNGDVSPHAGGGGVAIDTRKAWDLLKKEVENGPE